MHKLLRTAALSAFAALGIAAAVPAAQAEGLYLGFGGDGARFGIYTADNGGWGRHRDRGEWRDRDEWRGRHERRGWRRDDGWRRGPPRCSPERALAKAERLGLHRVRLRDVDRDTIRVSGRRHGERYTVTFARAPSCPVISF